MADDPLLNELARQTGTLDTDDRPALAARLRAARAYLSPHVDGYGIPKDVVDDCTLSVALDLWQAKDARNGIVGITDGVEPFRIPTDPLRTAWPKLRAAGLPAGLGIA